MGNWLQSRFEIQHRAHNPLPELEGLRGIAVTLVFFVHFLALYSPEENGTSFGSWLHLTGNSGVDLFFVLSGYLIYGSLIRKKPDLILYFIRRIQRIYPAFLAVLGLYLGIFAATPSLNQMSGPPGSNIPYIIQNILLLPGMIDIEPIIAVAWSLSYEMFFYIATPVLLGALRLRRWRPASRILLLAVLGLTCILVPHTNPFQRMALFTSGMIVAELKSPSWRGWKALALPMLLIVPWLGTALYLYAGSPHLAYSLWYGFLAVGFGCIVWLAVHHTKPLSAVLTFRPLRWLGNMSYSYYLIHGLAIHAFTRILPPPLASEHGPLGLISAGILTYSWTLLVAAVLYICVEHPLSLRPMMSGTCMAARLGRHYPQLIAEPSSRHISNNP